MRKSRSLVMLYRSKTDRVLCPHICIATRSVTPARIRFRIAVRRMSCSSRPGTFASSQACCHVFFRSVARKTEMYEAPYTQARKEGLTGQRLLDRMAELRAGDRVCAHRWPPPAPR